MTVDLENRVAQMPFGQEAEALVRKAVARTLQLQGETDRVQVSILLLDDEGVRALNREYRGIDRATDVLSFPLLEYDGLEADDEGLDPEELQESTDPETGEIMLGDIAISLERAKVQAEDFGHSLSREVAYLTVHAMLHLLGYDHVNLEDRALMRQREEVILTDLGLTREA